MSGVFEYKILMDFIFHGHNCKDLKMKSVYILYFA